MDGGCLSFGGVVFLPVAVDNVCVMIFLDSCSMEMLRRQQSQGKHPQHRQTCDRSPEQSTRDHARIMGGDEREGQALFVLES